MKINRTLAIYNRLSTLPMGKRIVSRIVCFKAPYFRSIRPLVAELRPGLCEVRIKKRRSVLNHLGSVHAIAMCNMVELAAGLAIDVTLPATHRWIPSGMNVAYKRIARSDLRALCEIREIEYDSVSEVPIEVSITDRENVEVLHAIVTMHVTERR